MKMIFVLVMVMLMAAPGFSLAQENAKPIHVGNKVCPFMNAPVSDETAVKVEYQGKIYNLCCQMCKKMFMDNPEAAVKKFDAMEPEASMK